MICARALRFHRWECFSEAVAARLVAFKQRRAKALFGFNCFAHVRTRMLTSGNSAAPPRSLRCGDSPDAHLGVAHHEWRSGVLPIGPAAQRGDGCCLRRLMTWRT